MTQRNERNRQKTVHGASKTWLVGVNRMPSKRNTHLQEQLQDNHLKESQACSGPPLRSTLGHLFRGHTPNGSVWGGGPKDSAASTLSLSMRPTLKQGQSAHASSDPLCGAAYVDRPHIA